MNTQQGYTARATVLLLLSSGYSVLELRDCCWLTVSPSQDRKAVKIEGLHRRSTILERIWIMSEPSAIILTGWDYRHLRDLTETDLWTWLEIFRLQRRPKILADFTTRDFCMPQAFFSEDHKGIAGPPSQTA